MRWSHLLLVIGCLACGSTPPTAPTPVPVPIPVPVQPPAPVIRDVAGNWAGEYRLLVCDQSGIAAQGQWCGALSVGQVYPVRVVLTQQDVRVSGTATLGNLEIPVSGSIDGETLYLRGDFGFAQDNYVYAGNLGGWETSLTSGNQMTGHFALSLHATTASGNMYVEGAILALTRNALHPV